MSYLFKIFSFLSCDPKCKNNAVIKKKSVNLMSNMSTHMRKEAASPSLFDPE
jgi:hypothetical protein